MNKKEIIETKIEEIKGLNIALNDYISFNRKEEATKTMYELSRLQDTMIVIMQDIDDKLNDILNQLN